ncbi:MAG: beta-phosphoglucomutase [Crocinitomicaceae bacterium]|nr:beta-phosphoglucomutase [Crocinitomicaceae bacterium]
MARIKALLFDLDGVIVSTEKNHFKAWRETASKLGIPFSEHDNEALKGVNRVDSLKQILKLGNKTVSAEEFESLLVFKNDMYLDSITTLSKADLLPGVYSLLLQAKSMGVKIGLGSSSKNAPMILSRLGITDLFDAVIDGNGVKYPKPDPEVFLNGAKALALSPSDCLVFEDANSGVAAAKAGGFIAIGVGNPLLKGVADIYFNDLTEFRLEEYA